MYERGGLNLSHLAFDRNLGSVHYFVEIFMKKSSQIWSNPVKIVRLRRETSHQQLSHSLTDGLRHSIPEIYLANIAFFFLLNSKADLSELSFVPLSYFEQPMMTS